MPMAPPTSIISSVSARNWVLMCHFRAPSARRKPISRMRSSTETSMMFMTPTPPIPSVRIPIKISSTCRPIVMPLMTGRNSSRPNIWMAFLSVGENCWRGESGQHLRLRARLELWRDGFKHEHVAVFRVPKVTRRGVGNPGRFVVAREVVAQLDLAVHGADHSKPHACDDDRFADCGASAKQLLAYARSQKHDATPFEFVERVDPAALRRLFVAHVAVFRANAADGSRADHAVSVGNAGTAHGLETRVANVVGRLLDHVAVGLFENDFFAGALAAGLFAGLLRPADDGAFAESIEAADKNFAEAAAVCDQQGDGGDSPYDAEHGERAASAVTPQCDPGFVEDLIDHVSRLPRDAGLRW